MGLIPLRLDQSFWHPLEAWAGCAVPRKPSAIRTSGQIIRTDDDGGSPLPIQTLWLLSETITDFLAGPGLGDVIMFDMSIFANFAAVLNASQQVGDDVVITENPGATLRLYE